MKTKFIKFTALFAFVLFALNSFCAVQAIFNYKQFMTPNKEIYVENYLAFVSSSLKYKSKKTKVLQARLMVTQIFKRGGKIVDFKKYEVLGPVLVDSVAVDFKDQKRFMVTPGEYEVEVEVLDLNNENSVPVKSSRTIEIKPFDKRVNLSDIELIDYVNKTGKEKNIKLVILEKSVTTPFSSLFTKLKCVKLSSFEKSGIVPVTKSSLILNKVRLGRFKSGIVPVIFIFTNLNELTQPLTSVITPCQVSIGALKSHAFPALGTFPTEFPYKYVS